MKRLETAVFRSYQIDFLIKSRESKLSGFTGIHRLGCSAAPRASSWAQRAPEVKGAFVKPAHARQMAFVATFTSKYQPLDFVANLFQKVRQGFVCPQGIDCFVGSCSSSIQRTPHRQSAAIFPVKLCLSTNYTTDY